MDLRTAIAEAKDGIVNIKGIITIVDDLILPENITLKGNSELPSFGGNNVLKKLPSTIIYIKQDCSIQLSAGCGIYGCLILREGFSFPEADTSKYKGTAIKIRDNQDDTFIMNSFIVGFKNGIVSNNSQRITIDKVKIDCKNAVDIGTSWDISRITDVHCWPFGTIGNGQDEQTLLRDTAFNIHDGNDWTKLTNCFTWGYKNSYVVRDSNEVTLFGCSSDNLNKNGITLNAGSTAFNILGNSNGTKLIGCQAAASTVGVNVNVNDNCTSTIGSTSFWGFSTIGIRSSDTIIEYGNTFRNITKHRSSDTVPYKIEKNTSTKRKHNKFQSFLFDVLRKIKF